MSSFLNEVKGTVVQPLGKSILDRVNSRCKALSRSGLAHSRIIRETGVAGAD